MGAFPGGGTGRGENLQVGSRQKRKRGGGEMLL